MYSGISISMCIYRCVCIYTYTKWVKDKYHSSNLGQNGGHCTSLDKKGQASDRQKRGNLRQPGQILLAKPSNQNHMGLCQHQPPRSPRDLGQTCYKKTIPGKWPNLCLQVTQPSIDTAVKSHRICGQRQTIRRSHSATDIVDEDFVILPTFFEDPPTSHKLRFVSTCETTI